MKIALFIVIGLILTGVVSADQSAETIKVTVGQVFTIKLDSNKTTGYEWQLAEPVNKSFIEFVGSKYIVPGTMLVGAGGKEEWTFKAIRPGMTGISLKYVRSWEQDVPPADKKSFVIIID